MPQTFGARSVLFEDPCLPWIKLGVTLLCTFVFSSQTLPSSTVTDVTPVSLSMWRFTVMKPSWILSHVSGIRFRICTTRWRMHPQVLNTLLLSRRRDFRLEYSSVEREHVSWDQWLYSAFSCVKLAANGESVNTGFGCNMIHLKEIVFTDDLCEPDRSNC